MLERAGYVVLEASESMQAMRICEEYNGRIDLVLTDVGLPRIRGPEFRS